MEISASEIILTPCNNILPSFFYQKIIKYFNGIFLEKSALGHIQ